MNRWQKLADEGRKKGWTPDKKNEKKNVIKKKDNNRKERGLKRKTNVVEIKID